MSSLQVEGRHLLKAFKKLGFSVVRIKGSHHIMKHPDGRRTVVPVHAGDTLGPGLLNQILKDVELTREQLRPLI